MSLGCVYKNMILHIYIYINIVSLIVGFKKNYFINILRQDKSTCVNFSSFTYPFTANEKVKVNRTSLEIYDTTSHLTLY